MKFYCEVDEFISLQEFNELEENLADSRCPRLSRKCGVNHLREARVQPAFPEPQQGIDSN